MRSQRAPRALALAILLSCALLARAADEGTALDRELYDVCRQKTPLVPLADVDSAAAEHDGWSPLHKASEMGHAAIVQMLLAKGADPLARTLPDEDAAEDAVGKTPLEVAKTEAVRELLREAEAAAEDAVLREAEDALKDEV